MNATCIHRRVMADSDPEYVYCIDCFSSVFVGKVLDVPSPRDPRSTGDALCARGCGRRVSSEGKRCRWCSHKTAVLSPEDAQVAQWVHRTFGVPLDQARAEMAEIAAVIKEATA